MNAFYTFRIGAMARDPSVAEQISQKAVINEVNAPTAPAIGAKDGQVSVVVFSDFQCPYCRALDLMLRNEVLAKVGDIATVRFRNLPLESHRWARDAALIGGCVAKQGDALFWRFAHDVFQKQEEIFSAGQPPDELEALVKGLSGVSVIGFQQCRTLNQSESMIETDAEVAATNSVAEAPTIFGKAGAP